MMHRLSAGIGVFILIAASAFGVRMLPADFNAQDVPIGKEIEIATLTISLEPSESAETLSIGPIPPEKSVDGYEPLPDTAFIETGDRSIFIPEKEAVERRITANFPDDPSFFNRRFAVSIRLSSPKKGDFRGSFLIETEANPNARPGGTPISVAPSNLDLDQNGDGQISIFNNDTIPHFLICYTAAPEIGSGRSIVALTEGCQIGDPVQFVPQKNSFIVEANGRFDLPISVPNEKYSVKQRAEVLLWVKDPSLPESARFVRLRWAPTEH